MTPRPVPIVVAGADYQIRVVGARSSPLRDFYHALLRLSWWLTFAVISAAFIVANAVFALGYLWVGGLTAGPIGGYADAFFFSVQTMGTIGYGVLSPVSMGANVLVVTETIVGLILTALATGLVFAKFSHPTARVIFTRQATISPFNGVPTLAFRVGNERGNRIIDVHIRATVARTERTAEGKTFYRNVDLPLVRDRLLSLARSWSVMHVIDEKSPLAGMDAATFSEQEGEIHVLVLGMDETTMQPVHALHSYFASQLIFGARHVDVLSETEDGNLLLDLTKFHELEPSPLS